ncbi:GntR family transcriptional regulator [Streptomyces sp. NPDC026672]|uniref:GntR family transcriptional regulator n=1 Tax=unclassified Streptomyces TaxID=2593676 RepID=UPI0033E1880F
MSNGQDGVMNGLRSINLARQVAPLREQVLEALRNAILDFDLKPGQRLVERELIESLGVSRTTVREVLRELTAEGLVTVIPQKGAVVYAPSPSEAADLYAVRAALEGLAVQRFMERASAEHLTRLRDALARFEEVCASSEDMRELLRAKDGIYDTLLAGADSPTIQQILSGVQARVQLLRATSMSQPGRPRQAVAEMRALVEAIAAGDTDEALRLSRVHLEHASATVSDALDSDGVRPAPAEAGA